MSTSIEILSNPWAYTLADVMEAARDINAGSMQAIFRDRAGQPLYGVFFITTPEDTVAAIEALKPIIDSEDDDDGDEVAA